MKTNDDELLEKLKELKVSQTLDSEKKKSMKKTIQKHARKEKRSSKIKTSFMWVAAAAVILISGVLVYPVITNDAALPADDNQQNEENETESNHTGDEANHDETDNSEGLDDNRDSNDDPGSAAENADEQAGDDIHVEELGKESYDVLIEGMEEASTLYQFRIEPYGIEYEIDESLYDYAIEDESVRHHVEQEEMASVRLSIKENVSMEEIAEELENHYYDEFEEVSNLKQPDDVDSPYSGLSQTAIDTSGEQFDSTIGYYVFQIEEDALIVEYDFMVEAGDGMMPRLRTLIESLKDA